ncbi:MAG: DEAD/DEAH box helicase, partial [Candidatus Cloacimonetes bacterium]|nr:DEAD/DEAH box helicase [Candidatus Cloacimonadota bacterium]
LAQTGTGKTAAFGLPLIQQIDISSKKTQVLVLSPTRELCLQIVSDLRLYSRYVSGLNIVAVYGGADIERQIAALNRGAHIIVATPGRMNDLLNRRGKIDLSYLRNLVLDEADEMLNMGFKEELDAILDKTPPRRRTLLFSATMPDEVLKISKNYMESPIEITIGGKNQGAENVEHFCYLVHARDRYLALKRIVDYNPEIYGIVFCRTRRETKEIAAKLIEDGYNADALHGDLSQSQRESSMQKFRVKNLQILVATDVAARGIDVKDLTHIINYNLPDDLPVYIHRSGRTGRAGKTGVSIAIANLKEKYKIKSLETILKKQFTYKAVPSGEEICAKQLLSLVDKLTKIEVNHKEIDKFLPAINEKLEWLSREDIIKHFVSLEFNRFLDYYKDAKDLSTPEHGRRDRGRDKGGRSDGRDERKREMKYQRFRINLGHKDGVVPLDLISLINRCTHHRRIEIGKIDLQKSFSFVDVDNTYADLALKSLKDVEFNGKVVVFEIAHDAAPRSGPKRGARDWRDNKKRKGYSGNKSRKKY